MLPLIVGRRLLSSVARAPSVRTPRRSPSYPPPLQTAMPLLLRARASFVEKYIYNQHRSAFSSDQELAAAVEALEMLEALHEDGSWVPPILLFSVLKRLARHRRTAPHVVRAVALAARAGVSLKPKVLASVIFSYTLANDRVGLLDMEREVEQVVGGAPQGLYARLIHAAFLIGMPDRALHLLDNNRLGLYGAASSLGVKSGQVAYEVLESMETHHEAPPQLAIAGGALMSDPVSTTAAAAAATSASAAGGAMRQPHRPSERHAAAIAASMRAQGVGIRLLRYYASCSPVFVEEVDCFVRFCLRMPCLGSMSNNSTGGGGTSSTSDIASDSASSSDLLDDLHDHHHSAPPPPPSPPTPGASQHYKPGYELRLGKALSLLQERTAREDNARWVGLLSRALTQQCMEPTPRHLARAVIGILSGSGLDMHFSNRVALFWAYSTCTGLAADAALYSAALNSFGGDAPTRNGYTIAPSSTPGSGIWRAGLKRVPTSDVFTHTGSGSAQLLELLANTPFRYADRYNAPARYADRYSLNVRPRIDSMMAQDLVPHTLDARCTLLELAEGSPPPRDARGVLPLLLNVSLQASMSGRGVAGSKWAPPPAFLSEPITPPPLDSLLPQGGPPPLDSHWMPFAIRRFPSEHPPARSSGAHQRSSSSHGMRPQDRYSAPPHASHGLRPPLSAPPPRTPSSTALHSTRRGPLFASSTSIDFESSWVEDATLSPGEFADRHLRIALGAYVALLRMDETNAEAWFQVLTVATLKGGRGAAGVEGATSDADAVAWQKADDGSKSPPSQWSTSPFAGPASASMLPLMRTWMRSPPSSSTAPHVALDVHFSVLCALVYRGKLYAALEVLMYLGRLSDAAVEQYGPQSRISLSKGACEAVTELLFLLAISGIDYEALMYMGAHLLTPFDIGAVRTASPPPSPAPSATVPHVAALGAEGVGEALAPPSAASPSDAAFVGGAVPERFNDTLLAAAVHKVDPLMLRADPKQRAKAVAKELSGLVRGVYKLLISGPGRAPSKAVRERLENTLL